MNFPKRHKVDGQRYINEDWMSKYFVTCFRFERVKHDLPLIDKTVRPLQYAIITTRMKKREIFGTKLLKPKEFLRKDKIEQKTATRVNFVVTCIIVKVSKLLCIGVFVKHCILDVGY
ncbi:hypothetical protein RF11_15744 [Thelohanellus kitauei]|uniref:Uncharacterized protein n=1 Tax=Thelohanellus kitauei TaxID=669202 RepID=A0A0C2M7P9_THEKT|nr:hypothetical protein RF11_15744 [Thelohanellus kitauei]